MVSFFGIKFRGGDKKKNQTKDSRADSPQKSWDRNNPKPSVGQVHTFPTANANFSRPGRPKSRPGTSYSTYNAADWRAPFLAGAGAAQGASSSMVDLSVPSMPSQSPSLKPSTSDANLRKTSTPRWDSASTTSTIDSGAHPSRLPPTLGGGGSRPGTPSRATLSSKKEWVNPLDVHFSKEQTASTSSTSSRPGTPTNANIAAAKSPLGQFEFGLGTSTIRRVEDDDPIITGAFPPDQHGYPSPPQSIDNGLSDRSWSPIHMDNRTKTGPNALRRVDTAGSHSLPSPAASVIRNSQDLRWDGPVIRNVQAKRDTLTIESPRRQSFTMELEDDEKKQSDAEGFVDGNVALFDFGATFTTSPVIDRPASPSNSVKSSKMNTVSPRPESPRRATHRAESPLRSGSPLRTESPLGLRKVSMDERRTAQERGMSEPMTNESDNSVLNHQVDTKNKSPYPEPQIALPAPPTLAQRRAGRPAAAAGMHPGHGSTATRTSPLMSKPAKFDADTLSMGSHGSSAASLMNRSRADSDAVASLNEMLPLDRAAPKPRTRTTSNASTRAGNLPTKAFRLDSPPAIKIVARVDSDTLGDKDMPSSSRPEPPLEATPPQPQASRSVFDIDSPRSVHDDRRSRSRRRSLSEGVKSAFGRTRAKSEAPLPRSSSLFHLTSKTGTSPPLPTSASSTNLPGFPSAHDAPSSDKGWDTPNRPPPTQLASSAASTAPSPRSPYGPPPDQDSYLSNSRRPPPAPTFSASDASFANHRQPSATAEGKDFGSSKGLPRGRRLNPPPFPTTKAPNVAADTAGGDGSHFPWDRSNPRKSAMVAPLTPGGSERPTDANPNPSTTTPTSATAPRIPSPTFLSLEKSICASPKWIDSFDLSFDSSKPGPINTNTSALPSAAYPTSPTTAMRVEAAKAPPRNALVQVEKLSEKEREAVAMAEFGMGSPTSVAKEFEAGFI